MMEMLDRGDAVTVSNAVAARGTEGGSEMATAEMRVLEEKALNAWPCIQQTLYDGWMLRFAHGYTRRANSVVPLYQGHFEVERKIRKCEESYWRRSLQPVFKMLPFAQPEGLDDVLEAAGYGKAAETCVQARELEPLDRPAEHPVQMWDELADEWLEVYARFSGIGAEEQPWLREILEHIAPEKRFAALVCDGRPVSCGIGVREDRYLGLFGLVTEASQRSRGFGRQLITHLARWGREAGAQQAYLQVMVENHPARHLYARLGFAEVYRYWYRIKEV